MTKLSLFKKLSSNYKKHTKIWLIATTCSVVAITALVAFLLAGKVADDYLKAYESWQKDQAAQFIAHTSPKFNPAMLPRNARTQ